MPSLPTRDDVSLPTRADLTGERADIHAADGRLSVSLPEGAFDPGVHFEIQPLSPSIATGHTMLARWRIVARHPDKPELGQLQPRRPIKLSYAYTRDELDGLSEPLQRFIRLDEEAGAWVPLAGDVDLDGQVVTAETDHLTEVGYETSQLVAGPGRVDAVNLDLHGGSAQYAIPIEVPPGPGGLVPDLTLRYSSAAVDEMKSKHSHGSWVGIGWSLDLPCVTYDRGIYTLLLNGATYELAQDTSGAWHTKDESFLRLTFDQVSWRIWDKQGAYYELSHTRYYWNYFAPSYYQHIYRWDAKIIRDTHSNEITVTWYDDMQPMPSTYPDSPPPYVRASYPAEITYGARDATFPNGRVRIVFTLVGGTFDTTPYYAGQPLLTGEIRSDDPRNGPYPTGIPAPLVMETRYLSSITVLVGGTLVRRYDLSYGVGGASPDPAYSAWMAGNMTLLWMRQIGADGVSSLPDVTFTYAVKTIRFANPAPNPALVLSRPYLTDVNNGFGATTHFDYTELPTVAPQSQWSRQQVSTRRVDSSNAESTTIEYLTAASYLVRYVPGTGWDYVHARYRGFGQVRETDAYRKITHTYYTTWGDGVSYLALNGSTDTTAEIKTGRETSQVTTDLGGVTQRTVSSFFGLQNISGPVNFVFLTDQYDQLGALIKRTQFAYDAAKQGGSQYGNLTDRWDWGPSNSGLWHRHLETIFYPRNDVGGTYLVGLPGTVSLYKNSGSNGNGDFIRRTQNVYDSPTAGLPGQQPGSLGELRWVRQVLEIDPNLSTRFLTVDTQHAYDSYGNRTTETTFNSQGSYEFSGGVYSNSVVASANPQTTQTTFDATDHAFPISVTNPLAQVTQQSFDAGSGQALTKTDPNNRQTTYAYDTFKRLTSVQGPVVTPGGYQPTTTYAYSTPVIGGPTTTRVTIQWRRDAGGAALWETTYQYLDGRGRVLQTQRVATVGGVSGVTIENFVFDAGGQQKMVNLPYFVASIAGDTFRSADFANPAAHPGHQRWFDALRRLTVDEEWDGAQILPHGQTSYADWTTTPIDANGHGKQIIRDAFGRVSQVLEYSGNGSVPDPYALYATTTYTYNEADELIQVQDAAGNLTAITFDKLGRKLSQADPDLGTWVFTYDSLGRLVGQTDARGQQTTLQYDILSRLTARGPQGAPAKVTIQYDQGTNGIGRRTSMTDEAGTVTWTYDEVGQAKTESRGFSGGLGTYATTTTYDALGRVATFTYPGGEALTHGYLPQGPLSQIVSSAGVSYLAEGQVNALGLPTSMKLGASGGSQAALVTRSYWGLDSIAYPDAIACPLGTPKQILASSLLDLSYAYQPNGNLRRLTDGIVPETVDYAYDFLDRLLSVSGGYSESVSFGDLNNTGGKIGNIQSYTLSGATSTYTYGDGKHKHAATAAGSASMTYDTNGNMVTRGSQALTFDWDNRLTQVDGPGVSLAFTYDGDGKRAKKTDQAGANTLYLGRLWEKNLATAQETQYVYALGSLIAMKKAGVVHYVLTDRLGSTSVQLSPSGALENRTRYTAFGRSRDAATGLVTDRRYTGQRFDEAVDLYDYMAREYDQTIGRFTQPDPAGPDITTPQSLNRYGYALNNPLKYVDPTGQQFAPAQPYYSPGSLLYNVYTDSRDPFLAFVNAPWGERIDYLSEVQQRWPVQGWLNVFEGVMRYEAASSVLRESRYVRGINSTVLYSMFAGASAVFGPGPLEVSGIMRPAVSAWERFFSAIAYPDPSQSPEYIFGLVGAAENRAIATGMNMFRGIAPRPGSLEAYVFEGFLESANDYRSMGLAYYLGGFPVSSGGPFIAPYRVQVAAHAAEGLFFNQWQQLNQPWWMPAAPVWP